MRDSYKSRRIDFCTLLEQSGEFRTSTCIRYLLFSEVLSLLGVAASVGFATSVRATGFILFQNYGYTTSAKETYGPGSGGTVGAGVNSDYTAGLYYFLGTTTLAAGYDNPGAGWELDTVTARYQSGSSSSAPGYFIDGTATIPDYTSGAITFAVTAYDGANYVNSSVRGHSAVFTLSSIATGSSQAGEFGPGLTSFEVTPVPEPSILTFSGIGVAALALLRRRVALK